ncbi:MAG: DUF4388 domain-containing protein [Deltaproteobacteria bacterium]|nr:DUF4388 domain-containing protein [Deltaproteobacteria bacterium]
MTDITSPLPSLIVVDDSPTALRLMESVLTQAGYDVTCLAEGALVLETVKRLEPKIVFLDTSLNDVDISDLCRKLSTDPDLIDLSLILMTNRSDPVAISADARITDHITKPFTPEALLALVEHLVGRKDNENIDERPRTSTSETAATSTAQDHIHNLAQSVANMLQPQAKVVSLALVTQLERIFLEQRVVGRLWDVMRSLPGTPSLAGDISVIPLPDILQALAFQRQTGILTAERTKARINIAYKNGAVRFVIGDNVGAEFLLGTILVREHLIEPNELELILQNRHGTTRRLGRQIVQLGYLSTEQLRRALFHQSSELVYELLRWRSGRFYFHHTVDLPPEYLEYELGVSMEALLMEGYRRVDEWGLIETVLPSFDLIPHRVNRSSGSLNLTKEEQVVYNKIDGRLRVKDIINAVGGSAFEVARIIYRLISAHIVEMVPNNNTKTTVSEGPLIT